jgi:hypothetical protein
VTDDRLQAHAQLPKIETNVSPSLTSAAIAAPVTAAPVTALPVTAAPLGLEAALSDTVCAASSETSGEASVLWPDLLGKVQRVLDGRAQRKQLACLTKAGKSILKNAGIDYNCFQAKHGGQVQSGHWADFGLWVSNAESISCQSCVQLVLQHKVAIHRSAAFTCAQQVSQEQQSGGQQDVEDQDADQKDEGQQDAQLAKRPRLWAEGRPGRPPKNEQVSFDVVAYLSIERTGMYRFLTRDDIKPRLPIRFQTDDRIDKEFSSRPVHCNLCGTFFHLPVTTNTIALKLCFN